MMSRPEPVGRPGQGLTERQRMIVEVIEDSVRRQGYGPTMREIGDAVGLASTSSVSHQLSRLAEKGYLSRGAGRPRTAVVHPLPLPRQLVGEGDLIMLKVVGDSMIGAAIADGDWVVVRRESDIENGDI